MPYDLYTHYLSSDAVRRAVIGISSDGVNESPSSDYSRSMEQPTQHFLDEPPASQTLTAYDREHMALYLRLLDSARWRR